MVKKGAEREGTKSPKGSKDLERRGIARNWGRGYCRGRWVVGGCGKRGRERINVAFGGSLRPSNLNSNKPFIIYIPVTMDQRRSSHIIQYRNSGSGGPYTGHGHGHGHGYCFSRTFIPSFTKQNKATPSELTPTHCLFT